MATTLFKNAQLVNEGSVSVGDLLVQNGKITRIGDRVSADGAQVVDVAGKYLLPGVIDDQVHFREPGLTHKAELRTESLAAAAGGTTSFMDMPNVKPASLTQSLLEARYQRAAEVSAVNYSFYMGASNDNLQEVLLTDPRRVCGIKAFMGSSTGNMLVDNRDTLDRLFAQAPTLIATHCEDEQTIRAASEQVMARLGDRATAFDHPDVRPREGCLKSSSLAVELAKKHGTRLHILHLTTADELHLFDSGPVSTKRITAEACVHHLTFSREDYHQLGNKLKCNPAVKEESDRLAIWEALLDDRIDVIATDHAPHTVAEKEADYWSAPGGVPFVQHSLLQMYDHVKAGKLGVARLVEKMAHAVADCFQIEGRGYLREGYQADLVILDPEGVTPVSENTLYSKCGWSPFEDKTFGSRIDATYVNGHLVYDGVSPQLVAGAAQRLQFNR